MLGDIYDNISHLVQNATQFDIINMDNLLEHVVDPKLLLEQAFQLLSEKGLLIIKVPNDFSVLQQYFFDNGIVTKPHWVAPLDHISYFNRGGLIHLCQASGFACVDFLSDQMIEFSALNPNTNYFKNSDTGKSCHFARVAQENMFHSISPKGTLKVYQALGEMGLGREIIGVFTKINRV